MFISLELAFEIGNVFKFGDSFRVLQNELLNILF